MTGPKPFLKRFLHIVRSRASAFKWEYPLLSLRSSSSFLRLLPSLLVTSISAFIFPSITCFRRQFLRKMWPIQLAFRWFYIYKKNKWLHCYNANLQQSRMEFWDFSCRQRNKNKNRVVGGNQLRRAAGVENIFLSYEKRWSGRRWGC